MSSCASPFNPSRYIGEVCIVTWSKSNPVRSPRRLITLCDSSDAKTTSTSDNATLIGTNIRPAICLRPPALVRDFNSVPGSVRAARHAGNIPNSSVVSTANSAVTQKTVLSGCTEIGSNIIGSRKKCNKKSLPYQAPTAPSALPTIAITKLSVNDCRTTRDDEAPNAVLTANSCCRAATRDIINPPIFTQQTSNTIPTKPCIKYSGFAYVCVRYVGNPLRAELTDRYAFWKNGSARKRSGINRANKLCCNCASSALACVIVTAGFKRPMVATPKNESAASSTSFFSNTDANCSGKYIFGFSPGHTP